MPGSPIPSLIMGIHLRVCIHMMNIVYLMGKIGQLLSLTPRYYRLITDLAPKFIKTHIKHAKGKVMILGHARNIQILYPNDRIILRKH